MTQSNEASAKADLLETLERSANLKTAREAVEDGAKGARKAFDQGWEWLTGTPDDPTAIRLGWEWFSEKGPEHRELSDDHRFTRRLKNSESVNQFRDFIYNKYDGHPPDGGSVTNYSAAYDNGDYVNPNTITEERFLGTWRGDAFVDDGQILFIITNESDWHSFFEGRLAEEANKRGWNFPTAPELKREQWGPGGQTTQRITWTEPVIPRTNEEFAFPD